MKKILNYIANAQGLGIKFLLLYSLVLGLIFALFIRIQGPQFIPYAQSLADQMLPIKIENGVVIKPVDTVKKARLSIGDKSLDLPLVIDTTVDTLDASHLRDGVYMTRTAIYSVNRNQVRINQLQGNIDLPRADYTDAFKTFLNWSAVLFLIFGSAGIFVFFFILSIFYAFCTSILNYFMKKKFTFDLRMRSSVISLITTYILFFILDLIGVSSGWLGFFLIVMLLQYFLLRNIPSDQLSPVAETSETEQKK